MIFSRIFFLLMILFCSGSFLFAETIKIKITRDASLSYHPKERNNQQGTSSSIKIKYFEEFGLFDADLSSLKGKIITSAYLVLKTRGGHKLNLNKGTDLKWLAISSVSSNWDEKKVCGNNNGLRKDWGWVGAKMYDVILGNGNSLRDNNILEPINGWHRVKIDTKIIAAMVTKSSHGILLADGSGHFGINCRIYTHEQGNSCPYLEITTKGVDVTKPTSVQKIKAFGDISFATQKHGAMRIEFIAPKDAFAYRLMISNKTVPYGHEAAVARWQIPFAKKSGEKESFVLRDLHPTLTRILTLIVIDRQGNESKPYRFQGFTSDTLKVPKLPKISFHPKGNKEVKINDVVVYAFPEITKVNPITGKLLFEDMPNFKKQNPIWSGNQGLVRLAAARAEIISFQLGFDGKFSDLKIKVSDLKGASSISNSNVKIWRNWYVGNFSEYALPWKNTLHCPMPDNKLKGQIHQAVTVDYFIPKETKAGDYNGTITITLKKKSIKLPLRVKVYRAIIPDEIHFNPELNCYGGPGKAGSDQFNQSFQLAHYHRCTINRVPYGQNGQVHKDWVPVTNTEGRTTSWEMFDKNLGQLLDGSLFVDNPRKSVPVASIYLPLFEGFPLDFKKHYRSHKKAPMLSRDTIRKMKNSERLDYVMKHYVYDDVPEKAFSKKYSEAFKNCTADFYKHFQKKKWNKTIVQLYLNNKPTYGYSLWTLDEPNVYRDWQAINYFAKLWKAGINDSYVYTRKGLSEIFEKGLIRNRPTFLFRGDISRPGWQGSASDGLMNIVYLGGGGFDKLRLIQNHKNRMPTILYSYGSCSKYTVNNWSNAAWCLKAFIHESDGVLPWQSLGNGLMTPDKMGNSLIVNAPGYSKAIASFRVHALRRGAQDAELLRLLQLKKNWSRAHIGLLISQMVSLSSNYQQKFTDQAAAQKFGKLNSKNFIELKESILILLEK